MGKKWMFVGKKNASLKPCSVKVISLGRARPQERPWGHSFRCGIFFWPGLKAGSWFRKGFCCIHWHCLDASSVVLALISAGTLLMTQTYLYVSVCCKERCTFTSAFLSVMAAKSHISKSPVCLAVGRASRNLRLRQDRLTSSWAFLAQQAQCLTCCTNRPVWPWCVKQNRSDIV